MGSTNIALLFIGWAVYWLSTAKLGSKTPGYTARAFVEASYFDIVLSLLNCITIVITHDQLSFELVDMSKPSSALMAGFMSTTVINQIIQHLSGERT